MNVDAQRIVDERASWSVSDTRWSLPRCLFRGPVYSTPGSRRVEDANPAKVSLRMQAYLMLPRRTVLDLYAGKGCLAWLYAKEGCERLICVEKHAEYFATLKRNLRRYRFVQYYNEDNIAWLEEHLPRMRRLIISHADFDAFGTPALQLQKFFALYPVRQALIISITDGIILNFRRLGNADLRRYYLQDFYLDEAGSGEPNRRTVNKQLGEYVFQVQRMFLDILCMRAEAQAYPLYFRVNWKSTACYSSYVILPKVKGAVDFKRYVGLRRLKYGSASTAKRSLRALKTFNA